MTYGVGMLVKDGLVMIADTRTNAGVDAISVYRKLHILADSNDRIVIAASAGNLSVTQAALATLAEGLPPAKGTDDIRRVADMPTMFRIAQLVGEAMYQARDDVREALEAADISSGVSMLLGGRIRGGALKLYLIYAAGNFIECASDSPFLQIGETKYGKPIATNNLASNQSTGESLVSKRNGRPITGGRNAHARARRTK